MVYIVCAWDEVDKAMAVECATVEIAEDALTEFAARGIDSGNISVYQAVPLKFTLGVHIEVD